MLRGSAMLLACFLASTSDVALAQTVKGQCFAFPSPNIAYQSWESDTNYDLYEGIVDGRKVIRVVGDIVNISKEDFGSLVRDVNEAPSNVAEIIFDAREINVRAPISFTSAKITILADKLKFGPEGSFYLTSDASAVKDGLKIVANEVAFENALPRPLQISLGDGNNGRTVEAIFKTLKVGGAEVAGAQAKQAMWSRTLGYSGLGNSPPLNFVVTSGSEALPKVAAEISEHSTWSLFFAFKVQKFFSRDAFNPGNKSKLNGIIDQMMPTIEAMGSPSAVAMLQSTKGLMEINLDAQGYSPFFVPRRDFADAQKAYGIKLEKARKQLDDLRDLILAAYEGKPLDRAKIAIVRDEMAATNAAITRREDGIQTAFTALVANEKAVVELNSQVEQQREVVRKHYEELDQRQKDASSVKLATTVVAMGAILLPTPASPVIAAGLSATGEMIYVHNTDPRGLTVESFATIAQRSAAFYEAAQKAQASWKVHHNDLATMRDAFKGKAMQDGKSVTKMDALKAAAKTGGDFAEKMKALYDNLQKFPEPTSLQMSQLEKEDQTLQGLLGAIGDRRVKQAKITQEIATLRQELAVDTDRQSAAMVLEAELLTMNPTNDKDVMRWKMAATALWRRTIESLYLDAMMLRRSLYFETSKIPDLPPDILQFPEEMTAYIRTGLYSPDGNYGPGTLTKDHLEREKTKHLAALGAIETSIDQAFDDYKSERAGGAIPYVQSFRFSSNGSETQARFIDQVNSQIRLSGAGVANNGTMRIPIPIDLPQPPLELPERLVQVSISNVEFTDPYAVSDKRLNFDVSYELAGEMWRNDRCDFVDMRAKGAMPRAVQRLQVGSARIEEINPTPLTFDEFRKYQSAPPARTDYYLSVQLSGDRTSPNWEMIPTVSSFTLNLRIVQ